MAKITQRRFLSLHNMASGQKLQKIYFFCTSFAENFMLLLLQCLFDSLIENISGAEKLGHASAVGSVLVEESDGTVIDDDDVLQERKDVVFMLLEAGDHWSCNGSAQDVQPPVPPTTLLQQHPPVDSSKSSEIADCEGQAHDSTG